MKAPKFTREERLDCKLTKEQIKEIPLLRKEGLSLREIGKKFNVSFTTIWRWTLSEEKRKEKNKKIALNRTKEQIERGNIASKKSRKRKRILKLKEMKEFERKKAEEFRKKNPNYMKEWLSKNPDYRKNYMKKYRKKHLDYYKK